jgi:hypothetical protein
MRIASWLLAVGAIGWSVSVFPTFIAVAALDSDARGIARGQTFRSDSLERMRVRAASADGGTTCWEGLLWDRLMVEMALTDDAIKADKIEVFDERMRELGDAARNLLRCSPRSAVAWFILYWIETRESGLGDHAFDLLRASYHFAPREAWIGVRRTAVLLPVLRFLPDDIAVKATAEFRDLVQARLFAPAAQILRALDETERRAILESLRDLPEDRRLALWRALGGEDVGESTTLALPQRPSRPWW